MLSGILNGIDTTIWDPAADKFLGAPFDRASLAKRATNKSELQARVGLARDAAAPLFGVVTRLTWQKGMDLLLACLPVLRALGAQLALIGSGEPRSRRRFAPRPGTRRTRSAVSSVTMRNWPTNYRLGRTLCWCPRGSSRAA